MQTAFTEKTNVYRKLLPVLPITGIFTVVLLILLLNTQKVLAWNHPIWFNIHSPVFFHQVQKQTFMPINTVTNSNTTTQSNGGNSQSQSSDNNNVNNNNNNQSVTTDNNNAVSVTNNQQPPVGEVASIQPMTVAQPVAVMRLPATGTPLVSWSFLALLPMGFFLRKFAKIT